VRAGASWQYQGDISLGRGASVQQVEGAGNPVSEAHALTEGGDQ